MRPMVSGEWRGLWICGGPFLSPRSTPAVGASPNEGVVLNDGPCLTTGLRPTPRVAAQPKGSGGDKPP